MGTPKRKIPPAWGDHKKVTKPKPMSTKTARCHQCKRESIPQAFHPSKREIKFCTFACGKIWLTKHPAMPRSNSRW